MDIDAFNITLRPQDLFSYIGIYGIVTLQHHDLGIVDDPYFEEWLYSASSGVELRIHLHYKQPLYEFISGQGYKITFNAQWPTVLVEGSQVVLFKLLVDGLQQIGCCKISLASWGVSDETNLPTWTNYLDTCLEIHSPLSTRAPDGSSAPDFDINQRKKGPALVPIIKTFKFVWPSTGGKPVPVTDPKAMYLEADGSRVANNHPLKSITQAKD
ncbi:hypothetical protein DFH28DRAFT_927240 [Melampsora americana]|nr:hypothetical protein DFH28DRAFT_927240 [Melampsora americana]